MTEQKDFSRIDNLELENAKLQLRVAHQRERIAELEDKIADLRVDLTLVSRRNQSLESREAAAEDDVPDA